MLSVDLGRLTYHISGIRPDHSVEKRAAAELATAAALQAAGGRQAAGLHVVSRELRSMGPGSAGILQALPASMLTKLCLGLALPDATPAAEVMAVIGSVGRQLSALQQLRHLALSAAENSCFDFTEASVRQQYVLLPAIRGRTNLTFLELKGVSVPPSHALALLF
jgi:hypothetical protein